MIELIKDIESALANGTIRCALGMALTLPDICGIVAFPEYKKDVHARYVKWCDNYLYNQGFYPTQIIDIDNLTASSERSRVISGELCYKLRCAYLHSGNLELNQREGDDFPVFHLRLSSSVENGIYVGKDSKNSDGKVLEKTIDARHLTRVLCNAAREYYQSSNKKSEFINHHISIVDVENELKKVRDSRKKFEETQQGKNDIFSFEELTPRAKEIYQELKKDDKSKAVEMIHDDPDSVMAIMELLQGEFVLWKLECKKKE